MGSYHYHCGGYPAHLHPNGVCPYAGGGSGTGAGYNTGGSVGTIENTDTQSPPPVQEAEPSLGWQQDQTGWWYRDSADTYKTGGVHTIDGSHYLFDANGYMLIGWQQIGDDWYYFDGSGHMLFNVCLEIDGSYYYFDNQGKWDQEYYDSYQEFLEMYN